MRILPFDYAVRNLGRSAVRLLLSVCGSVLVVTLVICAASFVRGMEKSMASSGSPNNVILLGAGSEESIERSEVSFEVPGVAAASLRGIKTDLKVPYVSPQIHMMTTLTTKRDEASNIQMVIRGVDSRALLVHDQVQIVQGRFPEQGRDEIMVGPLTATRMGVDEAELAIGKSLWFNDRQWQIVGHFIAPNTVMAAEVWMPLSDLMIATRRTTLSCIVIKMNEPDFAAAEIFTKLQNKYELTSIPETTYYNKLVAFYRPVRLMVWVTAILIGVGGLFGGLNTMYAAFASRVREIGMLQSIGFSRQAIVLSFVQESVVATLGGALIAAFLAVVLLDGLAVRFSMGAFGLAIDGVTIGNGLAAGLLLGLVGALPPAWRCTRLPIAESLKAA